MENKLFVALVYSIVSFVPCKAATTKLRLGPATLQKTRHMHTIISRQKSTTQGLLTQINWLENRLASGAPTESAKMNAGKTSYDVGYTPSMTLKAWFIDATLQSLKASLQNILATNCDEHDITPYELSSTQKLLTEIAEDIKEVLESVESYRANPNDEMF